MRNRQNRYKITFETREQKQAYVYPIGEEQKAEFIEKIKRNNRRIISCQKLYPINMEKHQHDFGLISNICFCRMDDMRMGEVPYDEKEYSKLEKIKEDADEFSTRYGMFNSPIGWFTGAEYARAKELIAWAQNHRMDACERAGIPYVEY